ncbi:ferredoxin family protein [Pseudonocardia sp. WMMC193]|uniref:4Fe-4S dicluster domain-containing protein n=1 Tax=Pseudonocardia sp. WMMC193 TaxID=2911965 RepID=UPI001F295B21|nr:ferredoxin family protein [Pseudonocardia sp. WMMC193]MCF7549471.1 ferredoxin family protein [Pseudonocardia sp. WMMC193]
MTYVITAGCIDVMDRSCLEQCPVDCIKPGERMLYIDAEVCIDCGACEPACPQEAIAMDAMLPEEMRSYVDTNAAFFAAGASVDPPEVASAPRRAG